MTPTEMDEKFEIIDRRLAGIEQILPTLAAKADLERFATKADLAEGLAQQRVFTESVRDEVRIVAGGLATLTITVGAIECTLNTLITRLEAKGVI